MAHLLSESPIAVERTRKRGSHRQSHAFRHRKKTLRPEERTEKVFMEPLTCLGLPKDPPSLFGVVPLQKFHDLGDMPREVRSGRFLKPLQKGLDLFPEPFPEPAHPSGPEPFPALLPSGFGLLMLRVRRKGVRGTGSKRMGEERGLPLSPYRQPDS